MKRLDVFDGQEILLEDMVCLENTKATAIKDRSKDIWSDGVLKDGICNMQLSIDGITGTRLNVYFGTAWVNGERIKINEQKIYDATGPLTVIDGICTPQSSGSFYIPLADYTNGKENYVWAQYLETRDPSYYTVHPITGTKHYTKIDDGYNILVDTVHSFGNPPTSESLFIGKVTAQGAGVASINLTEANKKYTHFKPIDGLTLLNIDLPILLPQSVGNNSFGITQVANYDGLVISKTGTGTGNGVAITNVGTGSALWVNQAGHANGFFLNQAGNGIAQTIAQVANYDGLSISKTGTGIGNAEAIYNAGSGIGLEIYQNGSGIGLVIDQIGNNIAQNMYQRANQNTLAITKTSTGIGTGISIENSGIGAGIYLHQAGAGVGLVINQDGAANAVNIVNTSTGQGFYLDQTGDAVAQTLYQRANKDALQIVKTALSTGKAVAIFNDGTGTGVDISQSGVLDISAYGLFVHSNAVQPNVASYLFNVHQDNAASAANVSHILNDGNGTGLYVEQVGSLSVNQAALGITITSSITAAGSGGFIINSSNASSTKPCVQVSNAGSGYALNIIQSGTGDGGYITNTGTGCGIAIDYLGSLATTKHALIVYSDGKHISADSALLKIAQNHVETSEPALEIQNSGVGEGAIVRANSTSYANTVLSVECGTNSGTGFNFIRCPSGNDVAYQLRGDGTGYADIAWSTDGSDVGELLESLDGKHIEPGYFVTLIGKKICISHSGEYILGVTSGHSSFIGNNPLNFQGKYRQDSFRRYVRDKNGNKIINDDYNPDLEYKKRDERDEWVTVGLLGRLRVRVGEKITGDYVDPGYGGKAINGTTYKVMEHIDTEVIEIFFK
jgi:hypothetical protein